MTTQDKIAEARLEHAIRLVTSHMKAPQAGTIPPYRKGNLSHREMLCMLAEAFYGISEKGGTNTGYWVDKFAADLGVTTGVAWCVIFVQYPYHLLSRIADRPDPLPNDTAHAQSLGQWAQKEGLIVESYGDSQPGDIVVYDNGTDTGSGHVDIITAIAKQSGGVLFQTIGGNTSLVPGYNRDGGYVAYKAYDPQHSFGDYMQPKRSKRYIRCIISMDKLVERYWA